MPLLTETKQVVDSRWQRVADADELNAAKGQPVLVPFALYQEHEAELADAEVAVEIDGASDFDALLAIKERFALIAIAFPAFRDGRGFSLARILRREGYKGDLCATGGYARDQIGYLHRVGFNLFEVGEEYNAHWNAAFDEISVSYQTSADEPRPLFAR